VLLLIGIGLLIVLPEPWGFVALAVCIALFVFEIAFFWRRVRGRDVEVGAHTLLDRVGTVVTPCRPIGQVSVGGELWAARCDGGADIGDVVRIIDRDELVLVVEHDTR
jgi:membrane protein implicated in regulation of membrane protease activity